MKLAIGFLLCLIMTTEITIFDSAKPGNHNSWTVVDDGVMGGLSKGNLYINEDSRAVFEGSVRLENNGGFSSIRTSLDRTDVTGLTSLKLRLKGDGKRYQVRVRSNRRDYQSYISYIQTSTNWETYTVALSEMYPTFRGRQLRMPNYPVETLEEFAILIGNKKAEDFSLLIDRIWLE